MNKSDKEFYTSAWCLKDEESFKANIPFEILGQSLKKYDSSLKIKIVILEGYDKLSSNFLNRLESLNFEIINFSSQFKNIVKNFPNINSSYNQYERNCFLRWIAFKEIVENRPGLQQFWHLDSDVVLHASLDELAKDTSGKTFMLEGCPVFVSVSDLNWFKTYQSELIEFEKNIKGYSQEASNKKDFCLKNDSLLCNQSLYRNPLGSDQDFLEYLVSAKIIKQDPSSVIFKSDFHLIQNPLVFSIWDSIQNTPKDSILKGEKNGELWYGNKRVPFIHYQGTFCHFASVYMVLVKLGLEKNKIIRHLIDFKIIGTKFHISQTAKIVLKLAKILRLRYKRERLIDFLMSHDRKTDQIHLVELINFINEKNKVYIE